MTLKRKYSISAWMTGAVSGHLGDSIKSAMMQLLLQHMPIDSGRHPRDSLESAAEVRHVGIAKFIGDCGDGDRLVIEEGDGHVEADLTNQPGICCRLAFQIALQRTLAEPCHLCRYFDRRLS